MKLSTDCQYQNNLRGRTQNEIQHYLPISKLSSWTVIHNDVLHYLSRSKQSSEMKYSMRFSTICQYQNNQHYLPISKQFSWIDIHNEVL